MSRERRNRRKRPARERRDGRCIFCGAKPPLTDEHVFADWLRRLDHNGEGVHVLTQGDGSAPIVQRGRGIFTRKLKIVCGVCNHGWMSGIEEAAKPLLIQMFNAKSQIPLSPDDQLTLARWAFKTVVVARYIANEGTFPAAHRREFCTTNDPPQQAQIWIGTASVPNTPTYGEAVAQMRYEPVELTGPASDGAAIAVPAYRSELRLFNVVFVVMGQVADSPLARIEPSAALGQALTPLWPLTNHSISWPPLTLDWIGGLSGLTQLPMHPNA